ncbi:MAG: hypothetical protein M1383_05015 [Patescibacteria group bacterium]|nr:hypothetical protein [Patescibacteria group bacterium]
MILVVAKHHNLQPNQVTERMYLDPGVRRAVLDELDGPELGSSSKVSVGCIILFFEAWEQQKLKVQ